MSKPLPLAGARNVRDLGGYPVAGGGRTRCGALLRADGLHALTPADCQLLYDYGVRTAVDLRADCEVAQSPDRLDGYRDIAYVRLPLLDGVQSSGFAALPPTMGAQYCQLLDTAGAAFVQLARLVLTRPGCLLFHCSAGKDRTGTAAMLFLKLCGVEDDWVVADYTATEGYMKELLAAQQAAYERAGVSVPAYVLQARPADMERTLAHLRTHFGTAARYLVAAGLSTAECQALREKLTEGERV